MTDSSDQSQGVAILGSTGSIGCNSLRVIESLTNAPMRVVALAAGSNIERLADQIATHLPEVVSVDTEMGAHDLRAMLFARDIDLPRIVIGEAGLVEVATHPQADCVISATVGAVGFVPTLKALEMGKRVALAIDDVYDPITVAEHDLLPTPSGIESEGIVIGVVRRELTLTAVLDTDALFRAAMEGLEGEGKRK